MGNCDISCPYNKTKNFIISFLTSPLIVVLLPVASRFPSLSPPFFFFNCKVNVILLVHLLPRFSNVLIGRMLLVGTKEFVLSFSLTCSRVCSLSYATLIPTLKTKESKELTVQVKLS